MLCSEKMAMEDGHNGFSSFFNSVLGYKKFEEI